MGDRVVIGVRPNNFGRFHAINLAKRNDTGRLIATSTTSEGVDRLNEFFGKMHDLKAREVVGAKVANTREFNGLLDSNDVDLVVVSAKEEGGFGNSIHIDYTVSGLTHEKKPFVLCEKPLSDGNDKGRGIEALRELGDGLRRFDLHAPVYLIFKEAAEQSAELQDAIVNARETRVCWAVKKDTPAFILDNLGPHSWSAIGPTHKQELVSAEVDSSGKNALIIARLSNSNGESDCAMVLSYEFAFRGAKFDDYAVAVVSEGTSNLIYTLDLPRSMGFIDAVSKGEFELLQQIGSVDNPLAAFLEAGVKGVPIVGAEKAIDLQRFMQKSYESITK
ncbi:MAG: hypothetical protein ABIG39_07235 [Candidatus Micrarchaeota archaeon]